MALVGWVGVGLALVAGKQEGLVACWEMLEHFTSAR